MCQVQAMHLINITSFACNNPRKQALLLWNPIFQYGGMEVGSSLLKARHLSWD